MNKDIFRSNKLSILSQELHFVGLAIYHRVLFIVRN